MSNGDQFSTAQKQILRNAVKGRRIYIRAQAIGPDGITRTLPLLEIIVG